MPDRRNVAHPKKAPPARGPHIVDAEPAIDDVLDPSIDENEPQDVGLAADETPYLREYQGDHGSDDDDPADQKAPGEQH